MTKPKHRKIWMFPRNIRYIEPWKLVQISTLLTANTGEITSQDVQDQLYADLAGLGIKVKANANGVSNSGGMRTYLAQLACLGFFWRDPATKAYAPTRAGELLLDAEDPVTLLRCQLLRMQYPSVYGLSPQVAVSPELRVKPFVFLTGLLREDRLERRLTNREAAVAVTYGRTPGDHEKCVEKILLMRAGAELRDVIDSVDDLRTPKRFHEDDPDYDWKMGLADIVDIANTAFNYMRAAQLVAASPDDPHSFVMNDDPEVAKEISRWLQEPIEKLDPDAAAAWQQRFGRFDQTKAVRRVWKPSSDGFTSLLQSRCITAVKENPYAFDVSAFVREEAKRWGKPESEIARRLITVTARLGRIEHDAYIEASLAGGGELAIRFEAATAAIFRSLGFDGAEHIGQRPAPRQGGYPDVYLRASGWDRCGFVDTKATSKYGLPLHDTIKLQTYYKDAAAEFPDPVEAAFFTYVAGGFQQSAAKLREKLQVCAGHYGRPVSAMTARALLDLAEAEEQPSLEALIRGLSRSEFYASGDAVLRDA